MNYPLGIQVGRVRGESVRKRMNDTAVEVTVEVDCEELVAAMAKGDEQSLSRLYEVTIGRVFGLARTITGNPEDAEEVACDVFAMAWEQAARFDRDRGAAIAWLLVMCRSRALDLLRRRRSRQRTENAPVEEAALTGLPDLLAVVDEGARLRGVLNELPEMQRQLIALAFFRDMSHAEIAGMLGLPLGTVKSHIRRGLAAMRQQFE
jgi:RNA polymerase sigma-70 factor (ECF subfamily)